MNQYVTGAVIRSLRERNNMTQAQLAEKLSVSDKTVSKWETGRGYPDISLLQDVASALHVSVAELLSGNAVSNSNISSNMMRSNIYVCPICGNVIHTMGEAVIHCHGVAMAKAEEEQPDDRHQIQIDKVEDEYFVHLDHDMTKSHYISFIAALSPDRIQMVKLYPEGEAQARFSRSGVKKIICYCNRDGLFSVKVPKL